MRRSEKAISRPDVGYPSPASCHVKSIHIYASLTASPSRESARCASIGRMSHQSGGRCRPGLGLAARVGQITGRVAPDSLYPARDPVLAQGPHQQFDLTAHPRRRGETGVGGQQLDAQCLGQGHISSVAGRQVVAQLPTPRQQGPVGGCVRGAGHEGRLAPVRPVGLPGPRRRQAAARPIPPLGRERRGRPAAPRGDAHGPRRRPRRHQPEPSRPRWHQRRSRIVAI
jgi:hypothetical protein